MTDVAERLLREVLAEDAARAPLPADLAGPARRRLRRRRTGTAATVAALAVAAGAVAFAVLPREQHRAVEPANSIASLVGKEWLLDELVDGDMHVTEFDTRGPMRLTFSDDRHFTASGCNSLSGPASITTTHLTLSVQVSTDVFCGPPPSIEDRFAAMTRQPIEWTVKGSNLRLVATDGDYMTFHERIPPYPHEGALALNVGTRDGWSYRVTATDLLYLSARPPGSEQWTVDLSVAEPGAVHANVGNAVLVATWARRGTHRATYTAPGQAPVDLSVDRFVSRAFASGFVPAWSDDGVFTFYDASGTVIA